MVQGMLDSARQAMAGSTPRLLSQTIYKFDWDEKTFSISDFDIIVLPRHLSCRNDSKSLKLKAVRQGGDYRGSFFECASHGELVAVVSNKGKAPHGTKLDFRNNGDGLIEVSVPNINLHAGKYYVARLEYKVAVDHQGRNRMMFAGAIQPSDYHEFCRMIDLPVNALKIMRFVAHATKPFMAWFFDPKDNNLFPDQQPAIEKRKGSYVAEQSFTHEIRADSLRARYFSVFVDFSGKSELPLANGIQWHGGVDEPPLGIGA